MQSSCKQSRPSQCSRLCLQSFSSNSCTFEPWFKVSPIESDIPNLAEFVFIYLFISEVLKHRLLVCFFYAISMALFLDFLDSMVFFGGVSSTSLASLASRIACNELDAVALAAACTAIAKSSPVHRRIRDRPRKHLSKSNARKTQSYFRWNCSREHLSWGTLLEWN